MLDGGLDAMMNPKADAAIVAAPVTDDQAPIKDVGVRGFPAPIVMDVAMFEYRTERQFP